MEQNFTSTSGVCLTCHQPILPQYYFCPNCGAKLNSAPLSTTAATQAWIYVFSIILPMICFIFVTRWPGVKYFKSNDPKAKEIGQIAWALLIFSTVVTIWLAIVLTQEMIKSTTASINADMSDYGL
jgi:hypothetical protein